MDRTEIGRNATPADLWLGYDGLSAPYNQITAVLLYQPVWDRRIARSVGRVPHGVRTVLLMSDGRVLPSQRALADLHARWLDWQDRQRASDSAPDDEDRDDELS